MTRFDLKISNQYKQVTRESRRSSNCITHSKNGMNLVAANSVYASSTISDIWRATTLKNQS